MFDSVVAELLASKCTLTAVARLARLSKEWHGLFTPLLAEMVAGLRGKPTSRQRFLLATEYKEREERAWRHLLREMTYLFPEVEEKDELRLTNLNPVAWWLQPL
jgi:hypothetical protein